MRQTSGRKINRRFAAWQQRTLIPLATVLSMPSSERKWSQRSVSFGPASAPNRRSATSCRARFGSWIAHHWQGRSASRLHRVFHLQVSIPHSVPAVSLNLLFSDPLFDVLQLNACSWHALALPLIRTWFGQAGGMNLSGRYIQRWFAIERHLSRRYSAARLALGLTHLCRIRKGTKFAFPLRQSNSPAGLPLLHRLLRHTAYAPRACSASVPHYRPGAQLSSQAA